MYSSILVLNSQLSLKDTLVLYKNIGFTVHLSDINILKIGFGSRMMKVILVIVYIQRNIQTINFLKKACNHAKEKILILGIPALVIVVSPKWHLPRSTALLSLALLFRPSLKLNFLVKTKCHYFYVPLAIPILAFSESNSV